MKITKVGNYFINPFFQIIKDNNVFVLKYSLANKSMLTWQQETKNSTYETMIKLLNKVNNKILVNRNQYIILRLFLQEFKDNGSNNIENIRDIISWTNILWDFNIHLYDLKQRKHTIWKGRMDKDISIILYRNKEEVVDLIKNHQNSKMIFLLKSNNNNWIIGPFLNEDHIRDENIDIIDKYYDYTYKVISFKDSNIDALGFDRYISSIIINCIIDYLSNYVYKKGILFNRLAKINKNKVDLFSILPLY